MSNTKRVGYSVILMLVLMVSGAFAYSGFSGYNQYYYTNNYKPSVYYSTPAQAYTYNHYYPYYGVYGYNYYYPATTYYTPSYYNSYYSYPSYSNYSTISFYNDGYGFSYTRGSACGYYGYYC
ncbi:MAG: hypothetical protein NTZ73_00710 [Candidatus Diapherotrites archaeon]|nr:hypothetical protein [Candidatus Diapherotrites archaeon]